MQYFHSFDEQRDCWRRLRALVKRGALLVTIPSLREQTARLSDILDSIDEWTQQLPTGALCAQFAGGDAGLCDDLLPICCYVVK